MATSFVLFSWLISETIEANWFISADANLKLAPIIYLASLEHSASEAILLFEKQTTLQFPKIISSTGYETADNGNLVSDQVLHHNDKANNLTFNMIICKNTTEAYANNDDNSYIKIDLTIQITMVLAMLPVWLLKILYSSKTLPLTLFVLKVIK